MMTGTSNADLSRMLLAPFEHFDAPNDVAKDGTLLKEEKLSILRAMEHEVKQLKVASEENMTGGEEKSLRAVLEAVRLVDEGAADRREAHQD